MAQVTHTVALEITLRLVASAIREHHAHALELSEEIRFIRRKGPPDTFLEERLRASVIHNARVFIREAEEKACVCGMALVALQEPANDEGGVAPHAA